MVVSLCAAGYTVSHRAYDYDFMAKVLVVKGDFYKKTVAEQK